MNNFVLGNESVQPDSMTVCADNFNVIRSMFGMSAPKFLSGNETEEELFEIKRKKQENIDREAEKRKDEVDLPGLAEYESIFLKSDFPEDWLMMNHIKFNRHAIKDKVVEFAVENELEDGTYGCPYCEKIFFKVEDSKIKVWSKHEIKQTIVMFHHEEKFGICCPGCN